MDQSIHCCFLLIVFVLFIFLFQELVSKLIWSLWIYRLLNNSLEFRILKFVFSDSCFDSLRIERQVSGPDLSWQSQKHAQHGILWNEGRGSRKLRRTTRWVAQTSLQFPVGYSERIADDFVTTTDSISSVIINSLLKICINTRISLLSCILNHFQ